MLPGEKQHAHSVIQTLGWMSVCFIQKHGKIQKL